MKATHIIAAAVAVLAISLALSGEFTLAAFSGMAIGGFLLADADAAVKITRAMPNGNVTVTSNGIDLGHGDKGDFLANTELKISLPAVTTGELPDGQTFTVDVFHDTDSAFGSETKLVEDALIQTGAGGAGSAAVEAALRLPVDVKPHVRMKITGSATAGDASAKNATMQLVF